MSNIFAPYARIKNGIVTFNAGSGALGPGHKNQHLNLDTNGAIYAVAGGVISYYGAGLPFDSNGRLVIEAANPVRVDQATPFTATNAVAVGADADAITRVDQGVGFTSEGRFAATGSGTATAFSNGFDEGFG